MRDERRNNRLTWLIALALVAAVFTRYDGWIMALVAWTAMGVALLRRGRLRSRTFWMASAVVVAAPLVWFAYNAAVFGDWLDFARGPYSAKAIELQTATPGAGPPHPGWHNPWVGLLFFVKVSEMDSAAPAWGNTLLALSVLGTAWGWAMERRRAFAWSLLLWFPVPFYAWSVAYGSVPIFIPVWWPHSWYNTRYGLELIPALALGVGFAARFVLGAVREFKPAWTRRRRRCCLPRWRQMRRGWCGRGRWFMWKEQRTRTRGAAMSRRLQRRCGRRWRRGRAARC